MSHLAQFLAALIGGTAWLAGLVLAKGFWSTFFACVFPFYAWYLVVETAMVMLGVPK